MGNIDGQVFGLLLCNIIALLILYQTHRRQMQTEGRFLKLQKLMAVQYNFIQNQMVWLENSQELLSRQIQELSKFETGQIEKSRISDYLIDLRAEYAAIQAGNYSNSWVVDAVLFCQQEAAIKQGIQVDCKLQDLDKETVPAETVAQILYRLFEYGMQAVENTEKTKEKAGIVLRSRTILNRFVIEFMLTGKIQKVFPERKWKKYCRKLGFDINTANLQEGYSILISSPEK